VRNFGETSGTTIGLTVMARHINDHAYFWEFKLDTARGGLLLAGAEIKLRPKSYAVLCHLVERAGRLVSKEELLHAVWGHASVTEGALTQCLIDIRRALGDDSQRMIRTVPRRGYLFDVPVTIHAAEDEPRSTEVGSAPSSNAQRSSDARRVGWLSSLGPHGRYGAIVVALTVTLVLLAAYVAGPSGSPPQPVRIAVLPFDNLSPDPEQVYFSDGLAGELIERLSRAGISVTPPTSSFVFRDSNSSVHAIAAALGVVYVLEGSVARDQNRLRIRMQLSDTSEVLWTKSYDRALQDVFEVQESIARDVADELRVELGVGRALVDEGGTDSLEAYDLYLAAVFSATRSQDAGDDTFRRVKDFLDRALDIDPNFARAWARKSQIHSGVTAFRLNPEREAGLALAVELAYKAIEVAPRYGEGYANLGLALAHRGEWLEAERTFEHAVELGYPFTDVVDSGIYLASVGHLERALETFQSQWEGDRLHPHLPGFVMLVHESLGDRVAADEVFERGEKLHPDGWFGSAASAWIALGRSDLTFLREAWEPMDPGFGELFRKLLDEDRRGALDILRSYSEEPGLATPTIRGNIAMWAAHFGDADWALENLEEAVRGSGLLGYLAWLPVFQEVRQLPAFKDFLVNVGLVDYWRETGWPQFCRPRGRIDFDCS
jgi:adenylate cyclase